MCPVNGQTTETTRSTHESMLLLQYDCLQHMSTSVGGLYERRINVNVNVNDNTHANDNDNANASVNDNVKKKGEGKQSKRGRGRKRGGIERDTNLKGQNNRNRNRKIDRDIDRDIDVDTAIGRPTDSKALRPAQSTGSHTRQQS